MAVLLFAGDEKPNIEVIILVCTGAAATLLWIMLILFIRKLRKVSEVILVSFSQKLRKIIICQDIESPSSLNILADSVLDSTL